MRVLRLIIKRTLKGESRQLIAASRRISSKMKAFQAVLLMSAVAALNATEGTPVTLNCKFEMQKHHWGEQYTCSGQNVVVTRYDTYIAEVSGEHLPGKSIRDVRAVYFQSQNSVFIPRSMDKAFPSLTALRVESSELTYLNETTLKDLRRLTHIHLVDNKIAAIPRKAFNSLSALIYLSLAGNKIRHFDSDLLVGMKNLRFFFIDDNEIEVVGSALFRNNALLEEISFANNRIRMIGTKLVIPITDLKIGSFAGNVCTNIDERYVPIISSKLTLEFDRNCNVVCPARASDTEVENLIRQNLKLKSQTMIDRMEKQTLRYNCERTNRILSY